MRSRPVLCVDYSLEKKKIEKGLELTRRNSKGCLLGLLLLLLLLFLLLLPLPAATAKAFVVSSSPLTRATNVASFFGESTCVCVCVLLPGLQGKKRSLWILGGLLIGTSREGEGGEMRNAHRGSSWKSPTLQIWNQRSEFLKQTK